MADYYTKQYKYKSKKKKSKKALWIALGIFAAVLTVVIIYFQTNVNRVLISVSEATVQKNDGDSRQ